MQRDGNGAWTIACIDHTMTWAHWTDKDWQVPASSGTTMASAVGQWLADSSGAGKHVHQDAVAWPGNAPCSKDDRRRLRR